MPYLRERAPSWQRILLLHPDAPVALSFMLGHHCECELPGRPWVSTCP